MRLLSTLAAAVVLAALALAACNSTETKGNRAGSAGGNRTASVPTAATPGHIAPSDGVKRVTTAELREAVDQGKAVIVDVRAPAAYQQNHIKGSINIPLEQMEARVSELPRDKTIATYCS